MDIVERLKVDIEMTSMSQDENERLISETLKLALSEIETLRDRIKKGTISYVDTYFKEEDLNQKNKYNQFSKIKYSKDNYDHFKFNSF